MSVTRSSVPDIQILEGVEVEGEARLRVLARGGPRGEDVHVDLWVRAQIDDEDHVVQVVIQPESQELFDQAIGLAWEKEKGSASSEWRGQ